MLIIVTGNIGIGKSSVCRKVADYVRSRGHKCGGIITYKANGGSIIVEDIETGNWMTLAGPDGKYDGPRVGNYHFNPEGIAFGIEAIRRGVNASLLVVDELGPLEIGGEGFTNAIVLVRQQETNNQLLVIRKQALDNFMPLFNKAQLVFETTLDTRDQLPVQIGRIVTASLTTPPIGS